MEYTYQQVTGLDGQVNPEMIKRLPDGVFIPNDPSNTDWQAYQVWLSEGNQPLPPAGA